MPETTIFHIDVNNAFLSWEAHYRIHELGETEDLRDIPCVIGGDEKLRHGIVLAKSMSAKKYKIQTGEPLVNARRKYPNIKIVPPNHKVYTEYSNRLIALLKEYAPVVEQFSIDEAFCDMTGTQNLYGPYEEFAHKLKDMIYEQLGFSVNIGISSNKLLAKMASDFQKPNRVHTLFPEEIKEKLWPLPVDDLFYVGSSTAQRLHSLGIHTIGELANQKEDFLKSHFKKHGSVIWNFANGRDMDVIRNHEIANKGYGNSTTLPFDVTDSETAKAIILSLSETVGIRLRTDNAYISVVTVQLVDHEFHSMSHQVSLPCATNITEQIYTTACELFDTLWNKKPIRLIGVSTGKATNENHYQYNLFDNGTNEKYTKLNNALDSIRNRYGADSVKRARFINDNYRNNDKTP